MKRVLFLCSGNSARSIMAEAYFNKVAGVSYEAFSAGSLPIGKVNSLAIEVLVKNGISAERAESKSWNMFSLSSSPKMDYVIILCDQVAGDVCPIWPGNPEVLHWSLPDPACVNAMRLEQTTIFENIFLMIQKKIDHFILQTPKPSLLSEYCAQGEVILFE